MSKLVVTGGGTGGHVFPAVEVAREALARRVAVRYFGSLRGQEGEACRAIGLPFLGFPTLPLYGLSTIRGWRALAAFVRARATVLAEFRRDWPDAVISTGGYASAPVVAAARTLGIPFVVHEQNAVPGRTNRILGRRARAVATVFHAAAEHFAGSRVVRTGMPVRAVLRERASRSPAPAEPRSILVVGGSQGARALNEVAPKVAQILNSDVRWLHLAGPGRESEVAPAPDGYTVEGARDAAGMAEALAAASLVICRSGAGTLSELAAFRRRSILVPYPHAFQDHQTANAREFADMGAATLLPEAGTSPERLVNAVIEILISEETRWQERLESWDIPDAASRILELASL